MTHDPSLFSGVASNQPLADRMRPTSFDDFAGQEHLVGPGKPLRESIERGEVGSIVLWGPPGSGKTTLARLIARYTDRHFEPFSAVTEGVPRVREVLKGARERRWREGRGTILFCDEIHRFNKAQQDAFLPAVEEGVITLIGATTENPSFELNNALLSRVRVFVLEPLSREAVEKIVADVGGRMEGVGAIGELIDENALQRLVEHADGDARRALNTLEALTMHRSPGSEPEPSASSILHPASLEDLEAVLAHRLPRYDKSGEEHYNLISALHKAVRGSDVEGALYWLARMLEGGEDPLYIARRVVRMASEDIGLADPRALSFALAAKEGYEFLGSPEGELVLAEAVIYLTTAPKSNRAYQAWSEAQRAAKEHPAAEVPLHIRNAPTGLMKDLGYGRGYRYDHAEENGIAEGQEYLPQELRGAAWYEPTDRGFEKTIRERLEWFGKKRRMGKGAVG